MRFFPGVILAGIALMLLNAGELPEPLHVRFRLADGMQIFGTMTAWDTRGFDGSFGRREWQDVATDDIWRLYGRVMDGQDPAQWIDLGRLMLLVPEGESKAERAFDRALRLDPERAAAIEAARKDAARVLAQREARRKAAEAHRLRTRTPEAGSFAPAAWPVLSEAEHAKARAAIEEEVASILQGGAMSEAPLDLPDMLVFSDLDRFEAAKWAVHIDSILRRLEGLFGLGELEPVFAGRAAVLLFREQDRFRLVEAAAFDQLLARQDVAICHFRGERVFLAAHRTPEDDALAAALAHETVHAFMHRYRSPRRLPPWANEGLAEHVTALAVPDAPQASARREDALVFIRSGGDVAALMAGTYEDRTWPERDETAQAVGALMIELMIAQNRSGFIRWVNAVKDGTPWPDALSENFGASPQRFLETAVQYWRVND